MSLSDSPDHAAKHGLVGLHPCWMGETRDDEDGHWFCVTDLTSLDATSVTIAEAVSVEGPVQDRQGVLRRTNSELRG